MQSPAPCRRKVGRTRQLQAVRTPTALGAALLVLFARGRSNNLGDPSLVIRVSTVKEKIRRRCNTRPSLYEVLAKDKKLTETTELRNS